MMKFRVRLILHPKCTGTVQANQIGLLRTYITWDHGSSIVNVQANHMFEIIR